MKNISALFVSAVVVMFFTACGTYRHYAPTANPALFKEGGEVHVSGNLVMTTASAQAAVSLTDHIAVMGQFAGGFTRYRSRDYEFAAGYYFTKENNRCNFFSAGLSWGNNWGYSDTTYTDIRYQGHYVRPFIQWNSGITGKNLFWKVKGDVMLGLKMSYFMYDGQHLYDGSKITSNYTLTEPFFMWGIGSRVVHFDIIWGIPMHLTLDGLDAGTNARTFPMNFSFGLRFLIGRKKSDS